MPITTDQLFDEPFYPQWMIKKALLHKWQKEGQDLIALNDFQWKQSAKETRQRILAKHGVRLRHGKP